MEPASLSLAIFALFSACMECFELIRVSGRIGKDYEQCAVSFDIIMLRFTRWAEAVGISQGEDKKEVQAKLRKSLANPDKELSKVKDVLELIQKQLKEATEIAESQAINAKDTEIKTKSLQSLHGWAREIATRRQRRPNLGQKMTWTLYRRQELNDLLTNLTKNVSALIELVPGKQAELCKQEISEIRSPEELAELVKVLQLSRGTSVSLDDHLYEVANEHFKIRRSEATWKNNRAGNSSSFHQGDQFDKDYKDDVSSRHTTYTVQDSEFSENNNLHQGNRYGS